MHCSEFQTLISEYIDGTLELGEQTRTENHLAGCEACRAIRDDLLQIVHFSQQLPVHAPSASLWSRIAGDLEVDNAPGVSSRISGWWRRISSIGLRLTVPQFAAVAAAFVVVVSAGVLLVRQQPSAVNTAGNFTDPAEVNRLSNTEIKQIEDEITRRSENLEKRKQAWDPELRQSFEKNLLYINQSLVECRHQLNDNPSDYVTQELMLNAYREKMRFLERFEKF
jgi:hypothetical protein